MISTGSQVFSFFSISREPKFMKPWLPIPIISLENIRRSNFNEIVISFVFSYFQLTKYVAEIWPKKALIQNVIIIWPCIWAVEQWTHEKYYTDGGNWKKHTLFSGNLKADMSYKLDVYLLTLLKILFIWGIKKL